LLEVAARGLRPDLVLSFLATAPLQWRAWAGVDDPVPSRWERVAREARIGAGHADWEARLLRLADEHETAAAALEQESAPASHARTTAAAARELARVLAAFVALLRVLPARAAWNDWVEAVVRILHAAFAPGAERDALQSAVERLRGLDGLGRTEPQRGDFRDALRGVLAGASVPPSRDRVAAVQLGAAAAAWGAPFDFVCLVALGEGEWPSTHHEPQILDEHAWRALRAVVPDPAALPSADRRREHERRWFADACDAARRRLVVSWARLDPTTGAERLPSALVLDLASQRLGRQLDYAGLMQSPLVWRVPLRHSGLDAGVHALHAAEIDAWIAAGLPRRAARRWVACLDTPAARGVAL
jgi:exonuclease V gamma subunit